ncbi:MAG: hypothetical protein AVDCRST_MAG33-71, partial [uncultured Thermomicrobiales bacterium]
VVLLVLGPAAPGPTGRDDRKAGRVDRLVLRWSLWEGRRRTRRGRSRWMLVNQRMVPRRARPGRRVGL